MRAPRRATLALAAGGSAAVLAACGGSHGHPQHSGRTVPAGRTPATRAGVGTTAARPSRFRIPPLLDPRDVYAADRPGAVAAAARHDPARIYVPNSESNTVDVIDPRTYRIVGHFATRRPAPARDPLLRPQDAVGRQRRGKQPHARSTRAPGSPGRPVPVTDPYNLYFTADGRYAIVVAERLRRLDFRDAHTMRLHHSCRCRVPGVDHMDFTADGRYPLASCEFSGQMIWSTSRASGSCGRIAAASGRHAPGREALPRRPRLLRRRHDVRRRRG